jgi:hypothetical protein
VTSEWSAPTSRKLVQAKLHDMTMILRGILGGFKLKVAPTTVAGFEARIRELIDSHPNLQTIEQTLVTVRTAAQRELDGFERRLHAAARNDVRAPANAAPFGSNRHGNGSLISICLPQCGFKRGPGFVPLRPVNASSAVGGVKIGSSAPISACITTLVNRERISTDDMLRGT